MTVQQLLVATHNQGKLANFADMFGDLNIQWLSLDDIGVTTDVAETGVTFRDNAILKATTYAGETGLITLADDSGLEVDALDGAPGVYTARYGGSGLTHAERYHFLLDNLKDVPWELRTARFRAVIVIADPAGKVLAEAEGVCEGMIAPAPAGDGGFGYDPVFYLPEWGKTMAQVSSAMKHQISHRGQAVQKIAPRLRAILSSPY
ncbi:MAG: RdgB/HAM1 family non-canonical purine NTP pyrophosphatase [Anaerolineales bacterium]|nr:RdgB/HAM1 family non-canonical purine NTP pyrophosphatase [Anaerolineales bacterium]MCA9931298.1 RdgB/HAM1 family non-canonical purine NTP pyrophosphatase [Anaerolineales bacterium]